MTHYRSSSIAVAGVAVRLGSCLPHGEGYEDVQERIPSEVPVIQERVSKGSVKTEPHLSLLEE